MNDPFADAQKREQVRLQAAAQQHAADLARQQAEENQRQQDLRKQQLVLQQQLAEKTQILLTFKVREKLEYIRQQWQCVWNRSPIQLDPTYEEGHLTSWVLHFEYIELERKITGGISRITRRQCMVLNLRPGMVQKKRLFCVIHAENISR